jgi:hypothetical protein
MIHFLLFCFIFFSIVIHTDSLLSYRSQFWQTSMDVMAPATNRGGGSADCDSSHRTCSMTILETTTTTTTTMSSQPETDSSAIIFATNLENNLIADTFPEKKHI